MAVALGTRLALEAGFLILLAVVLALADLSPALIILIMALGWVLTSLVEYFAWRQGPRVPARFASATEPAPGPVLEEEVVVEERVPPPPAPSAPPPQPEEQTMVEPQPEPPTPSAEPEEPKFVEERRAPHRLEPLQPRPRRRWGLFGPRVRPEGEESESREEET
jgi:hypothetical protein